MEKINYNYSPLVNKIREAVTKEANDSKEIESWFLPFHILEVEHFANKLCDAHPEADREVVVLSVWFHDIGRFRGIEDDHDVYGAEESKKVLSQEGVSEEIIDKVYEACRSHRCDEIKPKEIEAKILATADAMSHFTHGFYPRLLPYLCKDRSYEEARDFINKKLLRDFNDKISFEEARNEIKDKYEAFLLSFKE